MDKEPKEENFSPLRAWRIKPFSRRNMYMTNYKISCGKRVVENAYGILVSRFRVLQSTMQQESFLVMPVITAHMVLLNLQRQRSDRGQFQLENGFESKECVAGEPSAISGEKSHYSLFQK